jgi:hypothetical protein
VTDLEPGDIVQIPLGDGAVAYGRLLREPLVAVHDLPSDTSLDPELLVEGLVDAPVLFVLPVMNKAVTSGRWPTVGHRPLTDVERTTPVRFCKQDPISGSLSIAWVDPVSSEYHTAPASREECEALEREAVWEPEHVEDRLRDHRAGRTNKWVESLRLKG